MALDFKSQIFLAYAYLPSYSNWLLYDADLTSTYQYERRALQLLQWGSPARAVAAQVPDAPVVPRPPRPVVPRRAVRDDPPRPGRRDRLGGRRLPRDRGHVQRGHRPPLPRRAQPRALVGGHGTGARVPRRGQRPPVLRHRLPHHADRPDRRGDQAVRMAGRTGHARVRGGHGALVAGVRREPSSRTCTPIPRRFGLVLDDVRPKFADYTARMAQWTAH